MISKGHQLLVTGAGGFVGRALSLQAVARGLTVLAANRSYVNFPPNIAYIPVDEIGGSTDWRAALTGCDVVVHVAACDARRGI